MKKHKNSLIYKSTTPLKRCALCIYHKAGHPLYSWCKKLRERIQPDDRCHNFKKDKEELKKYER